MNNAKKFFLSTLVAAAAMTSTAFAEDTTITVETVDKIKDAISTTNTASGGTIDLGEVAYVYAAPLTTDADMATITNAGTYTLTGGSGALLNYELEVNPDKASGDFVLALNEAHVTMCKLTLRENATLSLTNSRLDYNEFQGGSAYLSVYSNSQLNLTNSVLGYNPYKTGIANPENYTHTGTSEDLFGPRISIYGGATITGSTIFTGPGQGTHEGFDVLGNAQVSMTDSTLHTNLINVGSSLESKRLTEGTDASNLSASLALDNVKVDNIQYRGDNTSYSGIRVGATDMAGTLIIKNGSNIDMTVINHTDDREQGLNIGAKGTVQLSDSSLKVSKITNDGTFTVSGTSTIKVDQMTSSVTMTLGGNDGRTILSLGSANGNGASVSATRLNIYNADVTLSDNVTVAAPTNVLHKIQDSTIDMGGKTLTYNGFAILDSYSGISTLGSNNGVTLKNGTFKVNTNHLCFQGYDHIISEDAMVNVDTGMHNSGMVNVYGSLTIFGQLTVKHGNFGYDNVGTTDSGWSKTNYPKSVLTVSGTNAQYAIENGHMFRVAYETENTGAGEMNVVKGASFSFTGDRSGTGLFYNANRVNVDAQSSFTVDCYYGYGSDGAVDKKGGFNSDVAGEMVILGSGVKVNKNLETDKLVLRENSALSAGTITINELSIENGATLTAVTIVNNGSITVNNATLNVTNLTGTGTLTMLGDSKFADSEGNATGVEVAAGTKIEASAAGVAVSATGGSIVFTSVAKLDCETVEISTLAANESVAIAWHFSIEGIESGESVTVETEIAKGLNTSDIKVFHKADDSTSWTDETANVDVAYDATTGKLSFTTNSFSKYAVAIPEPSTFGLFAGLGALALVGARRRRRA